MKKLSKELSKRVLRTLFKDPSFKDVYQIVCNKSKSKPYLVGGKLYRTLIETLYNYPARSHSCDFDFAATDIGKELHKEKFYKTIEQFDGTVAKVEIQNPYQGNSITMRTRSGHKIDLISIRDLSEVREGNLPVSIEGYLKNVPLSIQSIAMDVDRCEIFGKVGADSINEKYVWINNQKAMNDYAKFKGINVDRYVQVKADSIGFNHSSKYKGKKKDNSYRKNNPNPFFINTIDWANAGQQYVYIDNGAAAAGNTLQATTGGNIQWRTTTTDNTVWTDTGTGTTVTFPTL